MSDLWYGGEPSSFQNGSAVTAVTTSGRFRPDYARCATLAPASGNARSNAFSGGAVTSAWVSARMFVSSTATATNRKFFGVGLSGALSGLAIGTEGLGQLALWKIDASGVGTRLASEPGASIAAAQLQRIEIQVVNYGASATVNVYIDGTLQLTFTGDVTVAGMSGFDCVGIWYPGASNSAYGCHLSEVVVSTDDLRSRPGLVTAALTGAGTTDAWTGIYSTINGTTISDATPNYTNSADLDQQFNIADLPAGIFTIAGIKIEARVARSAGSTPTKIALGYNNGGVLSVGSDQSVPTAYATIEQLDLAPFAQSAINALQIMVRSKA